MKKTVVHYFKTHPNSNECFSTSDGFLFHNEGAAIAHSDSLKDKNLKGYRRDEYAEDIEKYDPNSVEENKEAEVKLPAPAATGKGKGRKGGMKDDGGKDAGKEGDSSEEPEAAEVK